MSNKEACRRIVQECKQALKKETDPEKRFKIATVGEEFNILMLELANKQVIESRIKKYWKIIRRPYYQK